jgi:SAM-dependent methyltransferase
MSIHPWAAAGFGSAAEVYELGRPDYPAAAVAFLAERLDLREGRTVVDLAAGTGKLTRLLATTGARVIAVEPVDEMRAFIEVEALAGTAEAIPLPDASADAVTVAQAFHWFRPEAEAEIDRILRPGGMLAIVRNRLEPCEFADILDRYRGHASLEGDVSPTATFPHAQTLDAEGLAARLASETSIATLPAEQRDEALEAVRALAPATLRYVTEVEVRSKSGETGGAPG